MVEVEHTSGTERRRVYTRETLETCFAESLAGVGPDRFEVAPAKGRRLTVHFHRVTSNGRHVLEAAISANSARRGVLVENGWAAPRGPGARYFRRLVTTAHDAVSAVVEACSMVYGEVGDENGWTCVARVQLGDQSWTPGIWNGDESEMAWTGPARPTGPRSSGAGTIVGRLVQDVLKSIRR